MKGKQLLFFYDAGRFYVSSADCQGPVEGFREFLLRNKGIFEELTLDIPLLQKQGVNQELSQAVSQLSQLKSFWLRISICNEGNRSEKEFDPCLGLIFACLEKLQELKLDFKDMEKWESSARKWMSEAFQLVPLVVKSLRKFVFGFPEKGLSEVEADTINCALGDLKQVVELDFLGEQPSERNRTHFSKILKSMKTMKAQRRRGMNLFFEKVSIVVEDM